MSFGSHSQPPGQQLTQATKGHYNQLARVELCCGRIRALTERINVVNGNLYGPRNDVSKPGSEPQPPVYLDWMINTLSGEIDHLQEAIDRLENGH